MRLRFTLPLIAIALVCLVGVGTAGAGDGGELGSCVVGAESPCTDHEQTTDEAGDGSPDEPIQYHPDELPYATGLVPEPTADGDGETGDRDGREITDGLPLAPEPDAADGADGGVGICVVGADSPCNGADVDSGFEYDSTDGAVAAECIGNETHTCEGDAWRTPDAIVVFPVDDGPSPSRVDGGRFPYAPAVPEPRLEFETVRCIVASCELPHPAAVDERTMRDGVNVDQREPGTLETSAPPFRFGFERVPVAPLFDRFVSLLSVFG